MWIWLRLPSDRVLSMVKALVKLLTNRHAAVRETNLVCFYLPYVALTLDLSPMLLMRWTCRILLKG